YQGDPVWLRYETLSVVGARNMHPLTQEWLFSDMHDFLKMKPSVALISGGAVGVDQASHLVCMRIGRPTVVVLPCGLNRLYPNNLTQLKDYILQAGGCLLSEFENEHSVRKSYFYHRNRLISAFSQITLVAQAERKSGTFLTVHHALQNGKTIITLPAHPRAAEFSGNKFLMREGAFFIHDSNDLHDFWEAESWSGRVLSSP
ncbi:MAG: DNA-processing protein DprA, partial [Pseudobdellovibrio sp.]